MDASTDPNPYNAVSESGIVISAVWMSNKSTGTSYLVYLILIAALIKIKEKIFGLSRSIFSLML
ncbi:MAG: hypothetical protein M3213_01720 [Thermoproteota archaeon]|nr:hypothetical protein [Thermoproteota archaeon]